MAKESTLKRNCKDLIIARGGFARSIPGGPHGAGQADLYGCYRGYCLVFETKLPGKESTLTVLQAELLRQAKDAGAIAKMITTVDQVRKILNAIDKRKDRK